VTDPTPPAGRADPVVARVNELTTTVLDFGAAILFATGVWFWADRYLAAGLSWIAAALVLLVFSQVAQWRSRPRASKPVEVEHVEPLPGANHPGNLHVMGR
jgi:hypothetical protein